MSNKKKTNQNAQVVVFLAQNIRNLNNERKIIETKKLTGTGQV